MMNACSCGELKSHVIIRRSTADGAIACLWSDGYVSNRLGASVVGKFEAKTDRQRESMRAAFEEVGLLDWAELPRFVREWKRARKLVGATDVTARAEVWRRMTPPTKAAPEGADSLYRESSCNMGTHDRPSLIRVR